MRLSHGESNAEVKHTGNLPVELAVRLESQLGSKGMKAFLSSLEDEPVAGLRFNTLKGSPERMKELLPYALEPIPWTSAGYTFPGGERPGKSPYYLAGLYYLQEPSAMAPAAALDVKPGERVLDLCAAPGGKATQLAAALAGKGVLVANDNSPKRIRSLIWNLEHWGAVNAVVLNEDPARLAAVFPGYFDKILIDAPCSGEGMLRKDRRALQGWHRYTGQTCRDAQDKLLDQAAVMLAPGGRMVYSTCTFNPLENEEAIAAFLEKQTSFRLVPLPAFEGWQPGHALKECRQLWPHLVKGEGQFLTLMEQAGAARKRGGAEDGRNCAGAGQDIAEGTLGFADGTAEFSEGTSEVAVGSSGFAEGISEFTVGVTEFAEGSSEVADGISGFTESMVVEELLPFVRFVEENLLYPFNGPFAIYGGHVYRVPLGLPSLAGLKVSRPGWYLGMIRNGRFDPGQPLSMGMGAKQMKRRMDLDPEDGRIERYLRGETVMTPGEKGWTLVTVGGYPLGFGKQTGDFLKNEYASGWRII
ncbi:MAG: RsmF rRNA methyltransferase first C-terminal domain-containing protein [Peptococcaceae bacterium]|jgi:NOL1/NOP2/sun family putative RNA methylase|nr:RsmF rRNA methyltransferase first C-terminal domain-containing protein [Peptococcaceae bacterium]